MLEFSLQGESNNYLKLTINRDFGFPDSTSPFGGYDTESVVEIKSTNYYVKGLLWITTGNIYDFYKKLKKCQLELTGSTRLDSYENNLRVLVEYDLLGHVCVSGEFLEKHEENNKLIFSFLTDQTFISRTIDELTEIYKKYGDNYGIKK
jgi:hypothetical protein